MDQKAQYEKALSLIADGFWEEVIEMLNLNPNLAVTLDEYGASLLHAAACMDGAPTLIKELIRLGANVSLESKTGATPLGNAIHSGHSHGLTTDENVRLLIEAGADLKGLDDTRKPPLMSAIQERRPNIIKMLIAAGADPLQKTDDGYGIDAYEYMELIDATSMTPYLPPKSK